MPWTYRELCAEADRREHRKVGLTFAVLVASGYPIAEAQTIAAERTAPSVSASADPGSEPVSFNSLGAILAAIARATPVPPPPTSDRIPPATSG